MTIEQKKQNPLLLEIQVTNENGEPGTVTAEFSDKEALLNRLEPLLDLYHVVKLDERI